MTLASLIRRYRAEWDAFHGRLTDFEDDKAEVLLTPYFNKTLREMIGVPAESADDGQCALEWIVRECRSSRSISAGRLFMSESRVRSFKLSVTIS